jgi:hypothetical protein
MFVIELLLLIVLMMEGARISEMSVDIQLRTRQYIPEDFELHSRRHENLKSHTVLLLFLISEGFMPVLLSGFQI